MMALDSKSKAIIESWIPSRIMVGGWQPRVKKRNGLEARGRQGQGLDRVSGVASLIGKAGLRRFIASQAQLGTQHKLSETMVTRINGG
jgi:hypothetical protein